MQHTFSSMHLSERAENFSRIISNAICTNLSKNTLLLESGMALAMEWLQDRLFQKKSIYIIGNGGSATIASHAQIDFLNVAKLKAYVLHEPSIMTCMANDYGYEHAFARVLETVLIPGDLLIAISSSGQSKNICQAVTKAKDCGATIITLSGFKSDNPLRQLGDLNYWLDSSDYGFVEVGHQFILHNLSDRFMMTNKSEKIENHSTTQEECVTDLLNAL